LATAVGGDAGGQKQVPGRKTDTKDAEWIADLLQHGLLRRSFVPDRASRDLRDPTRYRTRLSDDCGRVAARVEKVLEDGNIKVAAVASDGLGASGRAMLRAMIAGEEDPERLADLAKLRLRQKLTELRTALRGRVRDHHRFLLQQLLDELEFLESKLREVEQRIGEPMRPFERAVTLWKTIPGISDGTAWSLAAEIGVRSEQFASAQHLASWAGLCPGNHESAGKRYSGKTRKGNRWLRRILNQAA
jgi:transposase